MHVCTLLENYMKAFLFATVAVIAFASTASAQEAGSSSTGKFAIPNTPPAHNEQHMTTHKTYAATIKKTPSSSTGMFSIPNVPPAEVAGERGAHDLYVRNLHDSGMVNGVMVGPR